MQIEVGKTYNLNNGDTVTIDGMLGYDPYSVDGPGYGPFYSNETGLFHIDGRFADGYYPNLDIVSECVEEVVGKFRITSSANIKPKTWSEMSDPEKGALMLAHHEGKVIEWIVAGDTSGEWELCPKLCLWKGEFNEFAYRIKPEPKRETVILGWDAALGVGNGISKYDTHRITFDTIDGVPDCGSIKMEAV